jgi:hypothetical protein
MRSLDFSALCAMTFWLSKVFHEGDLQFEAQIALGSAVAFFAVAFICAIMGA